MFWTSLLPATIFLLANTLCVSQGASVGGGSRGGRQRLISLQEEPLRTGGDSNSPPQTVDNDFPSAGSSYVESAIPEWINSPHPDMNEDDNEGGGDDLGDSGNEGWEGVGGTFRFKLDENDHGENLRVQPAYNSNRARIPVEVVEGHRHGTAAAGARPAYYNADGDEVVRMKVGGKMIPFPGHLKRALGQQPSTALWPAKSYYRVPAEGFIRANVYDKRSPRCIAKCMQQGMVHPLQCHSLC